MKQMCYMCEQEKNNLSYDWVCPECKGLEEDVIIARIWGDEGENPYYLNKTQIKEDLDDYYKLRKARDES